MGFGTVLRGGQSSARGTDSIYGIYLTEESELLIRFQLMGGYAVANKPFDQHRSISEIIFGSDDPEIYSVVTKQPGPAGRLPLTAAQLLDRPSGDLFGWSQNV